MTYLTGREQKYNIHPTSSCKLLFGWLVFSLSLEEDYLSMLIFLTVAAKNTSTVGP